MGMKTRWNQWTWLGDRLIVHKDSVFLNSWRKRTCQICNPSPFSSLAHKTKNARQTNVKIVSLSKYVTMQMYVNVDDR